MKNETFRGIGYWGSFGAVILTVINIILCLVKAISEYKQGKGRDFMDVVSNTVDLSYSSVLFKVAMGILLFSLLLMFISYMINANAVLRVLMLIVTLVQIGSVILMIAEEFVFGRKSVMIAELITFAIATAIAFILYLVESDHRKQIIRMAVFTILVAGGGVVFMLIVIAGILLFAISFCMLVDAILKASEPKFILYDTAGHIIGWIRID